MMTPIKLVANEIELEKIYLRKIDMALEEMGKNLKSIAEKSCIRFCEALETEMYQWLVDQEGTREELIESITSLIYDRVEEIEVKERGLPFKEVIDSGYITESYLYVIKDGTDKEYIGGKIDIWVFLEDAISKDVCNESEECRNKILWVTDIRIEYERLDRVGEPLVNNIGVKTKFCR